MRKVIAFVLLSTFFVLASITAVSVQGKGAGRVKAAHVAGPKSTIAGASKATMAQGPKTTTARGPKMTTTRGPKTTTANGAKATTRGPKTTTASGAKTTTAKGPKATAQNAAKATTHELKTTTTRGPKTTTTATPTQTATSTTPAPPTLPKNPRLVERLRGLLPPNTDINLAATGFRNQGQFVATVHVSNNLGLNFQDLKTRMVTDGMSLGRAIHDLRRNVDAEAAANVATRQAQQDLGVVITTASRSKP
jgi:hypothetical protein